MDKVNIFCLYYCTTAQYVARFIKDCRHFGNWLHYLIVVLFFNTGCLKSCVVHPYFCGLPCSLILLGCHQSLLICTKILINISTELNLVFLAKETKTLAAMLTAEFKHTRKVEWKSVQSLTATNSVFENAVNFITVNTQLHLTLNQTLKYPVNTVGYIFHKLVQCLTRVCPLVKATKNSNICTFFMFRQTITYLEHWIYVFSRWAPYTQLSWLHEHIWQN